VRWPIASCSPRSSPRSRAGLELSGQAGPGALSRWEQYTQCFWPPMKCSIGTDRILAFWCAAPAATCSLDSRGFRLGRLAACWSQPPARQRAARAAFPRPGQADYLPFITGAPTSIRFDPKPPSNCTKASSDRRAVQEKQSTLHASPLSFSITGKAASKSAKPPHLGVSSTIAGHPLHAHRCANHEPAYSNAHGHTSHRPSFGSWLLYAWASRMRLPVRRACAGAEDGRMGWVLPCASG